MYIPKFCNLTVLTLFPGTLMFKTLIHLNNIEYILLGDWKFKLIVHISTIFPVDVPVNECILCIYELTDPHIFSVAIAE